MNFTKMLSFAGALVMATMGGGHADATTITWNLSGTCSVECGTDGPNGNTRTFTGSDGVTTVTASAWGRTQGSSNVNFQTAFLGHYSGGGLGVTNRDEGSGGSSSHTMDNVAHLDFIAFYFSTLIEPDSAFLRGYTTGGVSGDPDTDITVWIGTVASMPNFTGMPVGDLDTMFGGHTTNNGPDLTSSRTADFGTGETGNFVIIAARIDDPNANDMIKIASLSVATVEPPPPNISVPEPAAALTLLLGLAGIAMRRRRNA